MSINDIQGRRHSTNDHPRNLEAEEEIRPEPSILGDVVTGDAEAVDAGAAKDELRDDEDDAEFRFVFAAVASSEHTSGPVGQHARDGKAQDRPDEGAPVQIAGPLFVEE